MDVSTRFAILGDIAKETAKNVAMMVPFVRQWRLCYPRAALLSREITEADLVEYGFPAFEMLLKHISSSSIQGATVVEIGPGDNVVTGIPLLALGAAAYHAVDRFMGNVESETAHKLYASVAEELPRRYGIPREAVTEPSCYPRALIGSRVFLYPKGIEEFRSFNLSGVADLVFSHGVGQGVASPELFVQASYDFLKPGGMAIHLMQFGATGCWRRYPNPLTFLTVNGMLWNLTASHRGASNRVRCDEFEALFARSGFHVTTHVLEEITRNHVDEIRPFLAGRFKAVPAESLEVAVAVFACVKPG
jgi:SAM-dependent methyltransferase